MIPEHIQHIPYTQCKAKRCLISKKYKDICCTWGKVRKADI